MSGLVSKPILAASVLVPAIIYLGYLWIRHREEDKEEGGDQEVSLEEELQQVQEKLNNYKRSRLDTLEEEPVQAAAVKDIILSECQFELSEGETETEQLVADIKDNSDSIQADSEDETDGEKVEEERTTKQVVEPVFACSDIRYRNIVTEEQVIVSEADINSDKVVDIVEEVTVTDILEEVTATPAIDTKVSPNMTGKESECVVTSSEEMKIPDVRSALKDPICSPPSPHSYTSSPVKSEVSEEGENKSSSCEWSDLIEQDEREQQVNNFHLDSAVLTSKLSGLELGGGVVPSRGHDSGVVSPSEDEVVGERQEVVIKRRSQSGEDAGIGSETGDVYSDPGCHTVDPKLEENQLLAYHFHIPDYLCGKLIGHQGNFINKLKEECRCNVVLKEQVVGKKSKKKPPRRKKDQAYGEGTIKLCCLEGTRANIDKCLDLIKDKFINNPEVTFEQVNTGEGKGTMNLNGGSVSLNLAEGIMHDVFVSSIISGGHVFLQQPCHPTFFALERLDSCMTKTYSQFTCPAVPLPVAVNSVCVAPCQGGWYRCQVVAFDQETAMCDIKYLDYGGYHSVSATELRQIRTDFLSLPFQGLECYLANISPNDEENLSAFVLEELVGARVVQARMIGTNEQGVPMVHLYRANNGQTTMVNRELVDRNCAQWLETTIVQLDSPLDHPSQY